MGPKLDPNRIFDAEALRKPLGGLLDRSWRLLEPKKQSWNRSWSALGVVLVPCSHPQDPEDSPREGNLTRPGLWGGGTRRGGTGK